jgi:uncharacterized membrane protein
VSSGKEFIGTLLAGFGLFNLVEGIIDHQLLGIHHVYEYAEIKFPYDLAFLASGIVMLIIGAVLMRAKKQAKQGGL